MTNQTLDQDLFIYSSQGRFIVRGQFDGATMLESERAYEAIQFAIDGLADDGGEVRLGRGRYALDRPLAMRDNIWLHGSGRGVRLLVEPGNEVGIGILCSGLKGAIISDLAICAQFDQRATAGIVIDDCGDTQVRDVLCQDFAGYGIWLRNSSFLCELRSCKLANNGQANIYLDDLFEGRGGDFVPNLVASCITYGGGTGIETNRSIVVNIVGCVVYQPGRHGFHIRNTSNSVLVAGCRTFQCEENAVLVESSHELNVSSNIFCWHRGHGIVLRDVSWGAINGNEFIDQGVRTRDGSFTDGVVLSEGTQGVQVVGNTIFNWGDQVPMAVGVREDVTCRNNILQANNINFCHEADIISAGVGSKVADNLSLTEEAYVGMGRKGYPDFTRERLERFVQAV